MLLESENKYNIYEKKDIINKLNTFLEATAHKDIQPIEIDQFLDSVDFERVLNKAVYFKNLPAVKYLYDKYPEKIFFISANNMSANLILNLACEYNALDIAQWIIEEKGAEVNNELYKNLSTAASCENSYKLVEYLLSKGANVNESDEYFSETPLYAAVRQKNTQVAELLLQKGADVDKRDVSGKMPIHMAAVNVDSNMIKLLIKYGANPNETVKIDVPGGTSLYNGKTATEIFVEKQEEQLIITEETYPPTNEINVTGLLGDENISTEND